jgi:hypothetical protein
MPERDMTCTHKHGTKKTSVSTKRSEMIDMPEQPSIADALNALPPELRAIVEGQLKRTATSAREFQHVSHSQYYNEETVEGQVKRSPSGIENPNTLRIAQNKKAFGKRQVAVSLTKGRDGSIAMTNVAMFPVQSVAVKDGRLTITLNDTFNEQETKFIQQWAKAKYQERPQPASTQTQTQEASAESEQASEQAPVDAKAIKVALLKAKVKATDENVSLVQDLMKQGGLSLTDAVNSLAS